MRRIRAGALRTPVKIQRHVEGRRADGSFTLTPSTMINAWAAVRPMTGREYLDGQAVQSRVTHRVEMRWMEGVSHSDRITWIDRQGVSRVLGIVAVLDSEEFGKHMVLMCEELKS